MKTVPLPPNEAERLSLLKHLEMLDTESEEIFDAITRSIALICDMPVALVYLTDDYRQWFKPKVETDTAETPGDIAFFAHTIKPDEILVVPDLLKDERFLDNPLVTGKPKIRFYAGAPLKLTPTINMGTLCVIDYRPRMLDEKQLEVLELLANHIVSLIRLRLDKRETRQDFSALVMVKQKLQFQKDVMEAIFDNEPESVKILSNQGELEQINKAGLDMLEAGSLAEARSQKLIDYVLPEFRDKFSELENKVFHGEHAIAEYKIKGIKGTERWMESHAAPLYDQQSKIINLIAVTRDITRIKQAQRGLVLASRVFTEAQEGIIITDAKGTMVDVNPAFCTITGYSREEIIGQNPRILHSGKQAPDFYAALWKALGETGHWKGEIWNRRKNGELYAELISINALRDETGKAINYVALFFDITAVKQQQANLELMAHYDPVTILPTHVLFADRFKQALARSKRDKTLLAICYLGLDHFSQVNNTLGHETCDALLIETAKRIKASMREKDTASSMGGDEFALLIGDLHDIAECEHALDRIHRAIAEPHLINGRTASLTASSGISIYPTDNSEHEILLRHAEQAMRQAKREGDNSHYFFDSAADA